MTICETLVLIKAVQARIGELSALRNEVAGTKTYFEPKKIVEPAYDVKKVDQMITNLRRWLYRAEAKVKQSNAVTQVDIPGEVDDLLRAIE
jgi:trehalose utilization protein